MKGKGRRKRKQRGGNPMVIPAVLTAVNEIAKTIKPASKLKQTKLGKVPVISTILDTLSQMGYGADSTFVTANDGDNSYLKKRVLPIFPDQGQRGPISGSGMVRLTNY